MLALQHGDEQLAREALVMKNRSLDEATRIRDQLDDYRAQIQDIERALEALEMKLEGARGRIDSQRSSGESSRRLDDEAAWDAEWQRRARAGRDGSAPPARNTSKSSGSHLDPLDGMVDDFGSGRAFEEFDRMSSKINAMEADIEAMRDVSDDWEDPLVDPRRKQLEDIFDKMERKKKTDDDLADLKAKFE